jgi:signal transduction histidine kinase
MSGPAVLPPWPDARLLIVDDEEANVDLLEALLARVGYHHVTGTTDPRTVRDLAARHPPDLIVLDLHMPHLDGVAVMEQLAAQLPPDTYLPILVLTADVTRPTRERALAVGAADFLTKPFDTTELLLRIRNLLGARRLHLQLRAQAEHLSQLYAQAEQARAEAETALRQRDHVLSVVTHDLKQPLTALAMTVDNVRFAITASGLTGQAAELALRGLTAIEQAGARMNGMVGELLDLVGLQRGQKLALTYEPVELVGLVRREAEVHQAATRRHRLLVDSTVEALHGAGDPARLTRVFANLLSNAIKYSPDGGDITVSLKSCTIDGGAGAEVTVTDHGLGVPAADLPHLFTPFYRASNVASRISGTGVGLAGARWIVEQHGGTIAVASAEGVGTTVTVRLRLAAPGNDSADPSAECERAPTHA